MVRAPNTFPQVYSPKPRVYYGYQERLIDAFPLQQVEVGDPSIQLALRIIPPGDYRFQIQQTNHVVGKVAKPLFRFQGRIPPLPTDYSENPRGTLVLLHGYGLQLDTLLPWGLLMAESGWRCVLVDLRGHGSSTGPRIGFGTLETRDLSELLTQLLQAHERSRKQDPILPGVDPTLDPPHYVGVLGISYGAALAVRWYAEDPRITHAAAITPYAHLEEAILGVRSDYARWMPASLLRRSVRRIPSLLNTRAETLDPIYWAPRLPGPLLAVAAEKDRIAPPSAVQKLVDASPRDSLFLQIEGLTHEDLPFRLDDFGPDLTRWFQRDTQPFQ